MSNFTEEQVKELSKLARIDLTEEETHEIAHDLKMVLDYGELLHEVDVSNLSPRSHLEPQGLATLREDFPQEQIEREAFLSNAPEQVGGMIRVPPIITNE